MIPSRFPLSGLLVLLFSAGLAFSGEPFEGSFDILVNGTDRAQITLKGKKAKVAPPESVAATNGYPLIDFENMKMRLVSTKDKTWFELPLAMLEARTKSNPPKIEETGKAESLLGLSAKEYLVSDSVSGTKIRIWASSDRSVGINFLLGFQRQGEHGLVLARAARILLAERGLMPLKASASDKSGRDVFKWEVTALHPAVVAASTFEVPEGYKRVSMVAGSAQEKK
ncbi:MAG: DUF4412 domain-containing protein [Spirochaetes bacterium]|nr:DUF4412 domain-containing protein [Spirochaetota bacterium]